MKTLDKKDIEIINTVLKAHEWLRIIQFVSYEECPNHLGSIEVDAGKETIAFKIIVSPDFPLGNIGFICTSHVGYGHMMHHGLVCLKASPATTVTGKLEIELEKLKLWIEKYFIGETVDEHFEYLHFPRQRDIAVVFEETIDKEAVKGDFGKFDYIALNEFSIGEIVQRCWMALDLGNRRCRWANSFTRAYKNKFTGLWIKLNTLPTIERRQTIQEWKDLLPLLSLQQTKYLNDTYQTLRKLSAYTDSFILMLGYDIPDGQNTETHWETILVHFNDFPFSSVKISAGIYVPNDLGKIIDWGKSINASYDRMFGRGKLSNELTEKRILIIGTGAIGSQLFDILLRGGCKEIELCESDTIEPGNVCRGDFSFLNIQKPKLFELYNKGINVSPYVEISIIPGLKPMAKDNKDYESTKETLQKFDVIFDCSTDKYLSFMLDGMQLKGQVINFSISNNAMHLAVITGLGNIHLLKSHLFDRLVPDGGESFFVATGCWNPTFKASYCDILVLLTYAVNEINLRLNNGEQIISFFISKKVEPNKSINYELSYNV